VQFVVTVAAPPILARSILSIPLELELTDPINIGAGIPWLIG
jgi:hypothetical protein